MGGVIIGGLVVVDIELVEVDVVEVVDVEVVDDEDAIVTDIAVVGAVDAIEIVMGGGGFKISPRRLSASVKLKWK